MALQFKYKEFDEAYARVVSSNINKESSYFKIEIYSSKASRDAGDKSEAVYSYNFDYNLGGDNVYIQAYETLKLEELFLNSNNI